MESSPVPEHIRVVACPHLLSIERDRIDISPPAGGTVADHLRAIGWTCDRLSSRVYLDGQLVTGAAWDSTVPRAGQSLVVRAVPTGGGGGGKDALRIVAMIGVIAASIGAGFLPAFAAGGALAGWGGAAVAATSIIGTLGLNGLIPAPLTRRALPRPIEDLSRKAAA